MPLVNCSARLQSKLRVRIRLQRRLRLVARVQKPSLFFETLLLQVLIRGVQRFEGQFHAEIRLIELWKDIAMQHLEPPVAGEAELLQWAVRGEAVHAEVRYTP